MNAEPKTIEADEADTFEHVHEPADCVVRAAGQALASRKDQNNVPATPADAADVLLRLAAVRVDRWASGGAVMTEKIDPRTGRPFGDHGTALQAIVYAIEADDSYATADFLRCWYSGDLEEWPEFYAWLKSSAGERAK